MARLFEARSAALEAAMAGNDVESLHGLIVGIIEDGHLDGYGVADVDRETYIGRGRPKFTQRVLFQAGKHDSSNVHFGKAGAAVEERALAIRRDILFATAELRGQVKRWRKAHARGVQTVLADANARIGRYTAYLHRKLDHRKDDERALLKLALRADCNPGAPLLEQQFENQHKRIRKEVDDASADLRRKHVELNKQHKKLKAVYKEAQGPVPQPLHYVRRSVDGGPGKPRGQVVTVP
jgi:hypothetical protein